MSCGSPFVKHADIVDHDVDPAEPLQRRVPNTLERIGIRDVGAVREYRGAPLTQFVGKDSDAVVVKIDGHDVCTPVGQRTRDGAADTAGRSADDADLVAQRVHCGSRLACVYAQHMEVGWAGRRRGRRRRRCAGGARSAQAKGLHTRRDPGPAASAVGRIRLLVRLELPPRITDSCRKNLSTRRRGLRRTRRRRQSPSASRTGWLTRTWPPTASAATRAAIATLRPNRSSPRRTERPIWMPIRTRISSCRLRFASLRSSS